MKLLPADTKKRVRFELLAKAGTQVFVAGTFNNWNPKANPLKDNPDSGLFKVTLTIPPGRHEYKFIVNDVWTVNPNCTDSVPNVYGSMNNVIHA
jgi:1,4-alpha-glucan branching enzyme